MGETDLYGVLIVEATRLGHRLFRNNVGVAKYTSDSGEVYRVPYGVGGNGGADLIGWTRCGHMHLDHIAAIFTALECKPPGWRPRSRAEKERYGQQQKFLAAVRAGGGIAGKVESVADYHRLIGHIE